MRDCAVLLLALALGGCGGGFGPRNSPAPLSISAYGDSTTWSYTAIPTPHQASPTLPQSVGIALRASISNDGVPGATTADWIAGTCPASAQSVGACPDGPWAQDMTAEPARVVTIDLGINDAALLGMPVATFVANLRQMVQTAQASGHTVILVTSNPCAPTDGAWTDLLASYIPAEQQLAQSMGVPLVDEYDYVQSLPGWQSLLSDGVHPTQALYDDMAAFEAQQIASFVGA